MQVWLAQIKIHIGGDNIFPINNEGVLLGYSDTIQIQVYNGLYKEEKVRRKIREDIGEDVEILKLEKLEVE